MSYLKRNIWAYGVIALFVGFASLMISFATIASRHKESLVIKDYYAAEIAYQEQIDKMSNTAALAEKPVISYRDRRAQIQIHFPENAQTAYKGRVSFYRPDKPEKDFSLPLQLAGNSLQIIPTANMLKGAWRVKLEWEAGNKAYYLEKRLYIGAE